LLSYTELLAKVYEDENVELILDSLGCHSISYEQCGNLITCARPEGDNKRSVQIKNNEDLRACIQTRGVSGNLFDVVAYINDVSLHDAKSYIMNVCQYNENTKYIEHPLAWLNKVKKKRKSYNFDYNINLLDEKILNQYIYGDIKQYNKDNVSTSTLLEYHIGFDTITQRITTPIYDIYGNLSGVKGRATREQDMDYKFLYLYKTDQSKTFFNYYRAKKYCIAKQEVIVVESEKSVMQAYEFGVYNILAIGSSFISMEQLNLLLNLQCDIILAYDRDLEMKDIYKTYINFFKNKRNLYTIEDIDNILDEKNSPTDKGEEVWNKLYQNRRSLYENGKKKTNN